MPNYPYSYLTMHARDTILHIQLRIIITKAYVNFSLIGKRKGEKSENYA